MKGVIADCLSKLVAEKFGKDKWLQVLEQSGVGKETTFLPTADVGDTQTMNLITTTCKVLSITLQQAADAFGNYWVNTYAPKIYSVYLNRYKTAKDFIKGMDSVHDITTKTIQNAHPPRFEFSEPDNKTLIVTYKSARNLIDFYVGLVKGVATYYKTTIQVSKLSEKQVRLVFA